MIKRLFVPLVHILVIGGALFVTACEGSGSIPSALPVVTNTPDYISSSGCELPCWAGIWPGQTTKIEAERLLDTRYADENVSWSSTSSLDWIARGEPIDISAWGYVGFSGDVVSSIDISVNRAMSVDEFIAVLGEPSIVRMTINDRTQQCWMAELGYPERRVTLHLDAENYVSISESQMILGITLYSPDEMITYIELIGAHSFDVEWDGYRNYCQLSAPTGHAP